MSQETEILDLIDRWADAEQANDAERLDALLTGDFLGVGPVGFVLNRQVWLGRFAHGLRNFAFAIEEPQVRDLGTSAIVVGVLAQQTSVRGEDNSDRFRVTLVAARHGETWLLAHIHIGQLAVPTHKGG